MSEPEDRKSAGGQPGNLTAGGCALVALGLLILLPSGLCTAIMGYAVVTEGLGNDLEGLNFLITFLVIAVIGGGLVYAGWHVRTKG